MKPLPLTTVHDQDWNGASLIHTVFGAGFAIPEADGHLRTTAWNASLLRRAKSMVGRRREANPDALLAGLRLLACQADPVLQDAGAERPDWRRCLEVVDPFDHSRFAGSLD